MLEFKKCNDENLWHEFVIDSPQGSIFCQPSFLKAKKMKYATYFVEKNGNKLLGCILILNEKNNVINPSTYQGILFNKQVFNYPNHKLAKMTLDLTEFLLFNLALSYKKINFSLHHSIKDIRAFQWFNYNKPIKYHFKITPRYTGILNLNEFESFNAILAQSRKVRVQDYNKSIKSGFTTIESNQVDILSNLHQKTFERQGLQRSESEIYLVNEFTKAALDAGFATLLVCMNSSNTPAAASVFLKDDKTGYYLIGATDPEYRKYGVGTHVLFDQIKLCLKDKLKSIDFIGINSPQRGDFKSSFNAKSELYFDLRYTV